MGTTADLVAAREDKERVRAEISSLLEGREAARWPGARGRIPNFTGAEMAADVLAGTREWERAQTIKANPDLPQLPVRIRALQEGKVVYMAVPRLAQERPFVLLDPARLEVSPRRAASIKGADRFGHKVHVPDMRGIDLVVCGSVAVDRRGARIGKGGGYSDLEYGLLVEAGIIGDDATVVTTVHPLQIVDRHLTETRHDFRVDRIVTPYGVMRCRRRSRRPSGIMWDHLDDDKIASMPAIAALAKSR